MVEQYNAVMASSSLPLHLVIGQTPQSGWEPLPSRKLTWPGGEDWRGGGRGGVCVSPVFPCFENINKIRVWRQYKCMSLCVDSKVSSVYLLALIESFPSSLFKQFFFSKSVGFIKVKDLLGSLELLWIKYRNDKKKNTSATPSKHLIPVRKRSNHWNIYSLLCIRFWWIEDVIGF